MVKSKVPIEVQVKLFKKHKSELFDGRHVKPCSAQIFKTLSGKLGMSIQAMRISVVRKTNEILGVSVRSNEETLSPPDLINESIESENANEETSKSKMSESDCTDKEISIARADDSAEIDNHDESIESNLAIFDDDDVDPLQLRERTISFDVNVDSKQIFGVQQKTQGKKSRLKVDSGWAWKLRKIIWENCKTQCSWIFKSADPKMNGDVKCKGGCQPCGATITVHAVAGESMHVEIRNYDPSKKHPKTKCRLSAEEIAFYAKSLKNSSAHTVHLSEVAQVMKAGDPVPSHIPTENTLRGIKSRNGSRSTSTRFPKDALWSLVELKSTSKVVREISIYPFCVRYVLPMQNEFYKMATKRKSSVISVDATGMGIRTNSFLPQTSTERKMPVFLYTVACHSSGKTIPIYQLLSNTHTLSFHVGWLTDWVKNKKNPDEITLDDSAALVGACVKAFAQRRNTNEYISQSMDCLLLNAPPPKVFIRLDRSHFVKSLHKLEVLNKENVRIKVLVKRVLGFLIVCESLDVAKITIQDLFTVIRAEFATGPCIQSLENLKHYCGLDDPNPEQEETHENSKNGGHTFQLKENDDSYKNTTSYK